MQFFGPGDIVSIDFHPFRTVDGQRKDGNLIEAATEIQPRRLLRLKSGNASKPPDAKSFVNFVANSLMGKTMGGS